MATHSSILAWITPDPLLPLLRTGLMLSPSWELLTHPPHGDLPVPP